jgi:hypothetical protein
VRGCKLSHLRLARSDEFKQPETVFLRFLPQAAPERGTRSAPVTDGTRKPNPEDDREAAPEGDQQGAQEGYPESETEEQVALKRPVATLSLATFALWDRSGPCSRR